MSDPASVEKLAEHGIVDAVLDLLRARPAPVPPGADGDGDGDPADAPPTPTRTRRTRARPTPEARKAAAEAEATRQVRHRLSPRRARPRAPLRRPEPRPARDGQGAPSRPRRLRAPDPDLASPSLVEAAALESSRHSPRDPRTPPRRSRDCAPGKTTPRRAAARGSSTSSPTPRVASPGKVARLACLLSPRRAKSRGTLRGLDGRRRSVAAPRRHVTDRRHGRRIDRRRRRVTDRGSNRGRSGSPGDDLRDAPPRDGRTGNCAATVRQTHRRGVRGTGASRWCACSTARSWMDRGYSWRWCFGTRTTTRASTPRRRSCRSRRGTPPPAEDLGRRGAVRALRAMLPEVTAEPPSSSWRVPMRVPMRSTTRRVPTRRVPTKPPTKRRRSARRRFPSRA